MDVSRTLHTPRVEPLISGNGLRKVLVYLKGRSLSLAHSATKRDARLLIDLVLSWRLLI